MKSLVELSILPCLAILFRIADMEIIRTATNKAWVLGNDRFKAKVVKILNRQVQQKPRGGDRRSEIFKIQ